MFLDFMTVYDICIHSVTRTFLIVDMTRTPSAVDVIVVGVTVVGVTVVDLTLSVHSPIQDTLSSIAQPFVVARECTSDTPLGEHHWFYCKSQAYSS